MPPTLGGLSLVEKEVGLRRVAVGLTIPLQNLEGNQGIEEVASRSFMKTELCSESLEVGWRLSQHGEDPQLDRA